MKARNFRQFVAGLLSCTVMLVSGIAWASTNQVGETIDRVDALVDLNIEDYNGQSYWGGSAPANTAPAPVADMSQNDKSAVVDYDRIRASATSETYLITGVDSRSAENATVGAGDASSVQGTRTDTIMLAQIPKDRSSATFISLPRDLSINRPECPVWDAASGLYVKDQTTPAADDVKINSAYAVGGPACLVLSVQQMLPVKITRYLSLDFAGFIGATEAIGGVAICTERPLVDQELGTIFEDGGRHMIQGTKALDFVRSRKVQEDGGSDYGRMRRQQVFLSALVKRVTSSGVLGDPGKLKALLESLKGSIKGDNISTESLYELGISVQGKISQNSLEFVTLPTKGTNDTGNEIPDFTAIRELFTDAPLVDQAPISTKPTVTSPAPSSARPSSEAPASATTTTEAPLPVPPPVEQRQEQGTSGPIDTVVDAVAC